MYATIPNNFLTVITYGSHLYGTATPTSDRDYKAVVLPSYRDLILAKPLRVDRVRFTEDDIPVGDHETMPENGWESEQTPVQKFVHDYLGGQAYAVEMVYAVLQGAHLAHCPPPATHGSKLFHSFEALCRILQKDFLHSNVSGMTGFAMKQTFDYVRRGERYKAACDVLKEVDQLQSLLGATGLTVRLDTPMAYMEEVDGKLVLVNPTVLEEIVKRTGLEVGSTVNHNKTMRTLKLNGREYLETTALLHFKGAVEKLVDQYGERSTKAAETDVDWKSLSHAVRVYQQVIELLETGWVTFPRPNAANLLKIKKGEHELESVKALLRDLDDQTMEMVRASTLPKSDELRVAVDNTLYDWLQKLY